MPISAIDVAAFRKADRIVFRHTADQGSCIEAVKVFRATKSNPFEHEVRHVVPTGFHGIDYAREGSCFGTSMSQDEFSAFEMFHGPEMFTGVAASLKAGDELRLCWGRDAGRTQAVAEGCPGWHVDRLELEVRRGKQTLRFTLDSSVCQNNTARMIRLTA